MFNPLLVFPQPRDIPEFLEMMYKSNVGSKYDRLIAKYEYRHLIYHKTRKIFLERPEYTHYVWGIDDIIFTDKTLDKLIEDYNKYLGHDDEILVADMNIDMTNFTNRAFVTYKHDPPPVDDWPLKWKHYKFAHVDDQEVLNAKKRNQGIIPVSWSGLQLAIIPRHVIEHTTFNNDLEYLNKENDENCCCNDVIFAKECADNGFKMYVDLNAQVKHIKPSTLNNQWYQRLFMVGKIPTYYFILKADTNKQIRIS